MTPFQPPLFEVSTELNLGYEPVAEFRGRTFYNGLAEALPRIEQFALLVPPLAPGAEPTQQHLVPTPAIYRFSSNDENWAVYIGNRMVAANTRAWLGWDAYRSFVAEMISRYLDLAAPCDVSRFSIGFYNRIVAESIDELRQILNPRFPLPAARTLADLLVQFSRSSDIGDVLTQVISKPADNFTSSGFIAVNNVVRSVPGNSAFEIPVFLDWMDRAHNIAKKLFWNDLSEDTQIAWSKSDANY